MGTQQQNLSLMSTTTQTGNPILTLFHHMKLLKLLRQFDAEVLIGQMSFKQCADAYNYLHTHTASPLSEGTASG